MVFLLKKITITAFSKQNYSKAYFIILKFAWVILENFLSQFLWTFLYLAPLFWHPGLLINSISLKKNSDNNQDKVDFSIKMYKKSTYEGLRNYTTTYTIYYIESKVISAIRPTLYDVSSQK